MKKFLLGWLMSLVFFSQLSFAANWPKEVTDILGNRVVLERQPERIILASGYSFLALAFVDSEPNKRLVAWGSELKRFDPATYSLFTAKFPELAQLTTIGSGSGNELSAELILSLQPDVIIFDAWQAEGSVNLIEHLNKAGIKVVFIDYYMSPLAHTVPSTRLLGQIMGTEEKTETLIAFYEARMKRLTERLTNKNLKRPKVLLHAYPGVWQCCWSSGLDGVGQYIRLFNGDNIGASFFPNSNGGNLNLEYILMQDPEIYIATGHSGVDQDKGLPIGTSIPAELTLRQLRKIVSEPGLNALTAVGDRRVHGLWNYFSGSPFNIVAAEVMAKWIQPELYQDIDPQKTMDELNQLFLPTPLQGIYWITLN